MRTASIAALWIVRLGGTVQLVLGVLLWLGIARNLVALHMALGVAVVIAVWVLAAAAARAGARGTLVAAAVALGALTVAVGIWQLTVTPGTGRTAAQVLHLLIALGLLGMGDRLGRVVRR